MGAAWQMSQIGLKGGDSEADSAVEDGGGFVLLSLVSLEIVLLRCDVVWKRRVGLLDCGVMALWFGVSRLELVNRSGPLLLIVLKSDAECH